MGIQSKANALALVITLAFEASLLHATSVTYNGITYMQCGITSADISTVVTNISASSATSGRAMYKVTATACPGTKWVRMEHCMFGLRWSVDH